MENKIYQYMFDLTNTRQVLGFRDATFLVSPATRTIQYSYFCGGRSEPARMCAKVPFAHRVCTVGAPSFPTCANLLMLGGYHRQPSAGRRYNITSRDMFCLSVCVSFSLFQSTTVWYIPKENHIQHKDWQIRNDINI